MRFISSLFLLFIIGKSVFAQGLDSLEIQRYNETILAFLEEDYERVIQTYETLIQTKKNVELITYKMSFESYLKMAALVPIDSMDYLQKANNAYDQALKWHGKTMVSERWDIMEIKEPDLVNEKFTIVETQPEYPGGMQALYNFIGKNMRYPSEARRMGVEGRVYVQFIVNKDGSVDAVNAVQGIGSGCDEEAERVIRMIPKFNPGMQKGVPVYVRMVLPVYFKLANGKR